MNPFDKLFIRKKHLSGLYDQIAGFLDGTIETPKISVDDDDFAPVYNAVIDLESRLLLERENRIAESKSNEEFISNVSHQLKTPLAAIKLYCEMELQNAESEYLEKQLIIIEKMEDLIYSLLRLEKINADYFELSIANHNLKDIITQVLGELEVIYPDKSFKMSGEATIRCDEYWIGEAIKNIVKNACEYTDDNGSVEILIEDRESSIFIYTKDNGGGVEEENLPEIFKRFYRISREEKSGAGIGLSISKAIIEKHHGTVFAQNSENGLKVTICLPKLAGKLSISS